MSEADPIAEIERLKARVAELEAAANRDHARLEERVRLFEEMLETVPVGVVVADASGEILFGNTAIEKMVGHRVLRSKDTDSYDEWISFHPDGRRVASHEYPLARVVKDGVDEDELEVHYQRPDGSRFWMRIIGKAIANEDGDQIGAAVAVVNIDGEHRARDAQALMIKELNHRVKNAFSVTQAIANRTLRAAGVPMDLREDLDTRLQSYADAHARLVGTEWNRASLADVARDVLDPIIGDRLDLDGPDVWVLSRTGLSLSMVFYELATNAVKHGALCEENGRVALSWKLDEPGDACELHLEWQETGGPPATETDHKGFGTFVLTRAVAGETGGRVETDYAPEGYAWRLSMPCKGNADVRAE